MLAWLRKLLGPGAKPPVVRLWALHGEGNEDAPASLKDVNYLKQLLAGWDGKSDLDVVWGPELRLTQYRVDNPMGHLVVSKLAVKPPTT